MKLSIFLTISLLIIGSVIANERNQWTIQWQEEEAFPVIEVEAGSKVTWIPSDTDTHNHILKTFGSPENFELTVHKDAISSHTFNKVGEYVYGCALHPHVRNVIRVVEPKDSTKNRRVVYPWLPEDQQENPYEREIQDQVRKRVEFQRSINDDETQRQVDLYNQADREEAEAKQKAKPDAIESETDKKPPHPSTPGNPHQISPTPIANKPSVPPTPTPTPTPTHTRHTTEPEETTAGKHKPTEEPTKPAQIPPSNSTTTDAKENEEKEKEKSTASSAIINVTLFISSIFLVILL
eukprot:gene4672-5837_t